MIDTWEMQGRIGFEMTHKDRGDPYQWKEETETLEIMVCSCSEEQLMQQ